MNKIYLIIQSVDNSGLFVTQIDRRGIDRRELRVLQLFCDLSYNNGYFCRKLRRISRFKRIFG